ncbi:MAG: addiction module protein [Balneolaceae bacterium]
MSNNIALDKLTKQEKLQLMEDLWQDISADSDYSPPQWHKNILDERAQAISKGDAKFSDWNKAKEEIRKRVT